MNKTGAPLLSELKISEWKEEDKSPPLNQLFLLDVRLPEAFAASHIEGSLNIPASPTFAQWAGWLLPEETSIGLIFDNSHVCSEIIDQVRLMGFDQEIWCIRFDEATLGKSQPLTSFVMMEADELMRLQPSYEPFYIVDVRTPEEWQAGHITGAHSIPLLMLAEAKEGLPRNRTIALICRSGQRASIAASLLKNTGFSVVNILGGMQAWHQAIRLRFRTGVRNRGVFNDFQ